jgi:hypothetical protein
MLLMRPFARALSVALLVVVAAGCSLLPGSQPKMTLDVDGVTVTCDLSTSSIEGANPGPQAETLCRARARDAMGVVLANTPNAQIESVAIGADGATSVCYTNLGTRTCPQVLPAGP